jgi:hydroxymethylpyrimidine pyrophosphatase-like HAD family hydrolase
MRLGRTGPFDVVVTDLDRTFTDLDLALDPRSLAAARRLRQAGIPCILATGRRAQDLAGWPALLEAFDAFVLECGAVWGRWGEWRLASPHTAAVRSVAAALAAEGCAIEEGHASCSVPADWEARLEARPERPLLSVQPNRDRIDVVAAGVDKAVGLRLLLDELGLVAPRILSVGDGENDLSVFAAADHAVAVSNAADVVRAAADTVAPEAAAAGFVWAVEPLLQAAAKAGEGAGAGQAVARPGILARLPDERRAGGAPP